jgi:peptidoglycan/LPS O-acetylase OafA/YrhL
VLRRLRISFYIKLGLYSAIAREDRFSRGSRDEAAVFIRGLRVGRRYKQQSSQTNAQKVKKFGAASANALILIYVHMALNLLVKPARGAVTAKTPPPQVFYHPELDALRFGAFVMVFACHALGAYFRPGFVGKALSVMSRAGSCGVDLFFCLSAYLITEILLRERRNKGSINIRSFYVRRVLRIWPLYFSFLAFMILAAPRFLKQESLTRPQAAMLLLLVGNWIYLLGPIHSAASILWSVSIEEQFYLTWPLIVKFHARHIHAVCIGLLGTATLYRMFLVSRHLRYDAFWEGTFSRIDAICIGALIAIYLDGRTPKVSRPWLIFGGLTALFAAVYWGRFLGPRALFTYPLVAACCGVILLGTLSARSEQNPILVKLGRMSYGLYVFHAFSLKLAEQRVHLQRFQYPVQMLCAGALSVLLASASYRWLESPFLRLKDRFSYVRSAPALDRSPAQSASVCLPVPSFALPPRVRQELEQ